MDIPLAVPEVVIEVVGPSEHVFSRVSVETQNWRGGFRLEHAAISPVRIDLDNYWENAYDVTVRASDTLTYYSVRNFDVRVRVSARAWCVGGDT